MIRMNRIGVFQRESKSRRAWTSTALSKSGAGIACMMLFATHLTAQTWAASGSNIYFTGGNVGIGTTTSPQGLLDIDGYTIVRDGFTTANSQLVLYGNGTAGASIEAEAGDDYNSKRSLALNPWGGNVGIGTTSPRGPLDVNGLAIVRDGSTTAHSQLVLHGNGTTGVSIESEAGNDNNSKRSLALNPWGGNVGIGTTNPQSKLAVNGTITATEVVVTTTGWSDYVLDKNHELTPLSEVASFVEENHHLPGIPSAKEVAERGIGVGDMQAKLLAKIEELTLHMIDQEKRNRQLEEENQDLRKRMNLVESELTQRRNQ